jgi:hypothetical protein
MIVAGCTASRLGTPALRANRAPLSPSARSPKSVSKLVASFVRRAPHASRPSNRSAKMRRGQAISSQNQRLLRRCKRTVAPRQGKSMARRAYQLCCRRLRTPHVGQGTAARVGVTRSTTVPSASATIVVNVHPCLVSIQTVPSVAEALTAMAVRLCRPWTVWSYGLSPSYSCTVAVEISSNLKGTPQFAIAARSARMAQLQTATRKAPTNRAIPTNERGASLSGKRLHGPAVTRVQLARQRD